MTFLPPSSTADAPAAPPDDETFFIARLPGGGADRAHRARRRIDTLACERKRRENARRERLGFVSHRAPRLLESLARDAPFANERFRREKGYVKVPMVHSWTRLGKFLPGPAIVVSRCEAKEFSWAFVTVICDNFRLKRMYTFSPIFGRSEAVHRGPAASRQGAGESTARARRETATLGEDTVDVDDERQPAVPARGRADATGVRTHPELSRGAFQAEEYHHD